jgi:hypothetical protein
MTQTIEYVVKANATQATQAISGVEIALSKTETQANKAGVAIDKAAKPTRNLGQAGLEASRAIEDLQYGIGGIVNNIPSLVMALGGGAGLTAAISLAAVGVNQLYKNFTSVPDATDAAATAAKTHMDSVIESVADANKELENLVVGAARARISAQQAAVEEAKAATERLRSSFRDQFGINPLDMGAMGRVASQAQGGRDIWIERWNNQKQQMEKVRVAASDVMAAYKETTDAYNLAVEEQVLLSRYRSIEAERLAQTEVDAAVDAANAITQAEERAAKEREKNDKQSYENRLSLMYDLHVAMLDDEDKALAAIAKARKEDRKKAAQDMAQAFEDMDKERKEAERMAKRQRKDAERAEQLHLSRLEQLEGESLAARMAFDTAAMDHKMQNLDKLKAHEFKNLKDTVKQYEGMYNDLGQLAQGATTTLIGASEDYFKAKIEGAENAEMIAAAAVLSGIGDQLVGLGTKYLFEGAGMSILGDPRGPAMLGLGGLTIAAGVGMGAGSAAISHTAAGGTVGKALPDDKATKDPGASPRSSGGSGSGGPLIVNVAYGAGGPLPEDIAREIHKVTSSGNRRRGAA